MSVRTILTQQSRPYKIEIYGLQDDFIGTLQSYNDTFIGQVIEPKLTINDDGSQSFTCSIPKFYINPETNLKVENPRWSDINNGILATNTRVLKVFLQTENETKVYPFIVDKITDKRDSHFSVYKEIEANGLAFAELGKQGYKLELNSHTLETDYEKDNKTVATMNYWLDKVFPNEKDSEGNIIKWLTPWCYEIRMDWSQYTASNRISTKMYEDSYISSWSLKESTGDTASELVPADFEEGREKTRYIDCANSNKYNITQTIAEVFGVFCIYEYKCDSRGQFIQSYVENGKQWQGRKVIFYNRAIKTENPIIIEYQNNLATITRTADSSEVYTKLYVTPIESETMETGYVSIADTSANPTLDEFILNFDYLYSVGAISEYQYNQVKTYEADLHSFNTQLINKAPIIETLTVEVNNLKADIKSVENEIIAAQETLTQNQTLLENDVTNQPIIKDSTNPCSVIFTSDGDCYSGKLRLEGIFTSSIVGYKDFKYSEKVFSVLDGTLVPTNSKVSLRADDTKYYLLLDEYGFPCQIYTAPSNIEKEDGENLIYLELCYSPTNAYLSICEQLKNTIEKKNAIKETLTTALEDKEEQLQVAQEEYDNILASKEAKNQEFELKMGPALREGYWTPDSYEDPGEGVEKSGLSGFTTEKKNSGVELIYDSELFEGEETGYYYDSIFDSDTGKLKEHYYKYIPISNVYKNWEQQNIADLIIHLQNPHLTHTVHNSEIAAGKYFVLYGSVNYYFTLLSAIPVGATLELVKTGSNLILTITGQSSISLNTTPIEGAINATSWFEGINSYLGERLIYNNAGFIFAFIKLPEKIGVEPVLLLNDTTIDYLKYQDIAYSFIGQTTTIATNLQIIEPDSYTIYYPRLLISDNNVNYNSDLLKIITYTGTYDDENAVELVKYEDYQILTRRGKPYFTFKITNKNSLSDILEATHYYYINYQISRANEMLYLDAKEVALENSQPRYSYDLTVSNVPDQINFLELGQLVYISDHALGVHAATGYISSLTYDLAHPQDDEVTIQNYKTKFEDLFSTITASSEAMKNNAIAYDIAASAFTSDGQLQGSILQSSINNNNISFNYSQTNVDISPTEGIILTNTSPYMNGVYGQVALRGGGIFLSNAIDGAGGRIWSTGITPSGINASMITTGQLDTNVIRVFAGNNLAFQWNSEGIFAYKRDESSGRPDMNSYVRYSDKGLQYITGDFTAVDLGWEGLAIRAQEGAVSLTGDKGLQVFDQNGSGLVSLGRIDANSFGLQLYDTEGNITLSAINGGSLWLKDIIRVGQENGVAGLSGVGESIYDEEGGITYSPVRIWAGDENKEIAPFWVREDGSLRATKATIEGTIIAKEGSFTGTIIATEGAIGGWIINEKSLTSEDGKTSLIADGNDQRINVNNNFIVNADGSMTAKSGLIGNMTIENLEQSLNNLSDLVGDTNRITTQLISTKGNVALEDEVFTTKFEIKIFKGNVEFTPTEYENCYYYWQYSYINSDDDNDWFSFLLNEEDSLKENYTTVPYYEYSNTIKKAIYVRCKIQNNNKTHENGGE